MGALGASSRSHVLVVDDDAVFRAALKRYLDSEQYEVTAVADADAALAKIEQTAFDLVLTDLKLPGLDGIELVRRLRTVDADAVCIVITGFGSPERSIEALEAGAFWFVEKSYERIATLGPLIRRALEYRRLQTAELQLQQQLRTRYGFENIVGESLALRRTVELVQKVSDTDATMLLLGESGVGKELFARAAHWASRRADKPFVAINCAAIPDDLLESELFGHVRGSFTGATRSRRGRFAAADGGTLFLDEVGDMSPSLQKKLLRVVQEREVEPIGANQGTAVDVRIIAATNQDLEALMRERRFREDLYFRLAVVPVTVPPLRERREDVPLLVQHFLREQQLQRPGLQGIREPAMKLLLEYAWPGNVRELQALIQRLSILARGEWIEASDIPPELRGDVVGAPRLPLPPGGIDFGRVTEAFEGDLILQALEATGWNKKRAADLLNLKRTTLLEKIRSKGLAELEPTES